MDANRSDEGFSSKTGIEPGVASDKMVGIGFGLR
jgi:hypothetical protein